jgi:hypothetical protein
MVSSILWITSIVSFIGFIINSSVMLLVLSRGKKKYHLLFALILFTAVSWDIGIFLVMFRNSYPDEIILYQTLLTLPIDLFPAFVYHFTTTYLNQSRIKSTIAIYTYCILGPIEFVAGISQPVTGVYNYSWGSIGRNAFDIFTIIWWALYNLSILFSCWLLLKARKHESSPVTRRHITYIIIGFIMFCLAQIKVLVAYGIDIALFLPLGILMVSAFGALIGIAIIKDQLLDITVFVRKGIVYSILAALIIFIFDFSQHLIAKYLGDIIGGDLIYINFAIIAVVVGLFMPLKPKLEHIISNAFIKKKIEF